MTEVPTQRGFEDLLPRVKRPARLIGGEVGSARGFTDDPHEVRVVLAFPDVYEIGISNQAIQILYGIARGSDGVAVERTYLPWIDVIDEMRREAIPLLTLETWSTVASADILAVTLQHESSFTNLLELLDLAGVPVRAQKREDSHPLVIAGGPACSNFLPVTPFLDAIVVGDGEEVFSEILDAVKQARANGSDRSQIKSRLTEVEGVFVPGVSKTVVRRCVSRLDDAPYPTECLVPTTEGVHDRAWVEVMRGCTRGCRFCQAGMWYRPVRERSVDDLLPMIEGQLAATGHQEVALASLSTTDHSTLEKILGEVSRAHPELRVSLPSLRVDGAAVRLAGLASPTGASLTLAPEAGSQRMRDVVNKNVTEADILGAVREAVKAGKTTLKLYFMIGLPWEEDEDATAIADLCLKIRSTAREAMGSLANRLQMNVSVNSFVPKPFTPLQWAGMADRETLLRRQGLIKGRMRKRGVRMSFSRVDTGYLEAALARGSETMATVIEGAWRRGARLDSWTDQFQGTAWDEAFAAEGMNAESLATAEIALDVRLPWDLVRGVVDKEFLVREWEKASRRETTPDCRWHPCSDCGVCEAGLKNRIVEGRPLEAVMTASERRTGMTQMAHSSEGEKRERPPLAERHRYVATFSVTGRGRFLGHLDRAEIFRRAVRRAGGRLALSAGMRPKAILSLAAPLAVGWEGLAELAEFELAEPADDGFEGRLAEALPVHVGLIGLERYTSRRSLAARVEGASYEVIVGVIGATNGDGVKLGHGAGLFEASPKLLVDEQRAGKTRSLDVKEYVERVETSLEADGRYRLSYDAALSPAGTARPERVVEVLGELAGLELRVERVTRTRLRLAEEEK